MAVDKLVDSTQLDADLTSVANAIRTKGGTSASLAFPAGFVDAIDAIETGGGGVSWDDVATHNFSGDVTLPTATQIRDYAFAQSAITGISAPNAVTGANNMFNNCASLVSVNLPKMNSGPNYSSNWFQNCTSLVSLFLPMQTIMWNYFVSGCTSLKNFVMPKLGNTRTTNFNSCSSLEKVDIGNAGLSGISIIAGFWNQAPLLNTLILRYNTMCSLANVNAFVGAFASGGTGGTLYVPQALISSYQSATNWSTVLGYANNSIQAIEGSQYENYYADGTPIT